MTIPDGLFFDMDSRRLSPQARLLLVDCFRRANRQYATPVETLGETRAIRIVYREGALGMTRPAFQKARKQLLQTGFLRQYRSPKDNAVNRDWYWLSNPSGRGEATQ